ncbi:hypothetical protein [Streptomyces sp. NPDC088760]|uniref:hypothetical protein n=1 Tax=Streptomyces sp. NPDC088760 TaxID=3365890 RepID=UPI003810DA19
MTDPGDGPLERWEQRRDERPRPPADRPGAGSRGPLRRDDLDARYPGLLDAILAGAADDEALEKAPGSAPTGARARSGA